MCGSAQQAATIDSTHLVCVQYYIIYALSTGKQTRMVQQDDDGGGCRGFMLAYAGAHPLIGNIYKCYYITDVSASHHRYYMIVILDLKV